MCVCVVSAVAIKPEGKGSRQFVFSLASMASPRTVQTLDIAANSLEEMKDWMAKIREVTVTSEAKVSAYLLLSVIQELTVNTCH